MGRQSVGRLLAAALAWTAQADAVASGAIPPESPVIVEGRVVERSDWPAGGESAAWVVRVDEIVSGFVPLELIVVDAWENVTDPPGEIALGMRVHLVLHERDDGAYEILSWRLVPDRDSESKLDRTPGGISVVSEGRGDLAPELADAAAGAMKTYEDEVVEIVNAERLTNGGLPPLKRNSLLDASAELHSGNMGSRDFFAHCDLDTGTSVGDRVTAAGYFFNAAGENIAAGYPTPDNVMTAWMGSSGHRGNILSPSYREIGVGYVVDGADMPNVRLDKLSPFCVQDDTGGPYFEYWTQNFGRRNSVYPLVIEREAFETTSHSVDLYVYGEGVAATMRFRNETGPWSGWEPYMPDKSWVLSPGDGVKQVEVQAGDAGMNVLWSAVDTIVLTAMCSAGDATLALSSYTVSSNEAFLACVEITAGSGFDVIAPGHATLQAPIVNLDSGFSVGPGAELTVKNGVP